MQTSPDLQPTWIAERRTRDAARSREAELQAAQERLSKQTLTSGALPYWCDFLESLQANVSALSTLNMRGTLTAIPTQPKAPQIYYLTVFARSPFARQETLTLEFREAEAYIDVRGPVRDRVDLACEPNSLRVVGMRGGFLEASELADTLVQELVEWISPERR